MTFTRAKHIKKKSPSSKRARHVEHLQDEYDCIVIGSGLGGLTSANCLAKSNHKVALLEQHYILGGLAQYFKRKNHIFDISLHGFPIGMKKTLRKYWSKELADNIKQVESVRFLNPQFKLDTTFTQEDFTRILNEEFKIEKKRIIEFYNHLKQMNFYDDQNQTIRELFQQFFPDRLDVWRLLMEPITYANGSHLDDPAIAYGIVFSNFMSKGVYIYEGGTDDMINKMTKILLENKVDIAKNALVEQIIVENGKVNGVKVNGRIIKCKAVVSNAGLHPTINKLVGKHHFSDEFINSFNKVEVSSSSCQVYIGIKEDENIPFIGDLIFTSTHPVYDYQKICAKDFSSCTFSVYYPAMRPTKNRYTIVASLNAKYLDWQNLDDEKYQKEKNLLIDKVLQILDKITPIKDKISYVEAATPRSVEYYTLSEQGTSFGTKFKGLDTSQKLSEEIQGLFHAGSVGIIMSGWLGAANYGVITANNADKFLLS